MPRSAPALVVTVGALIALVTADDYMRQNGGTAPRNAIRLRANARDLVQWRCL